MFLELFDNPNLLHIPFVVFGNVPACFSGLTQYPFPQVIMDGLLGDPGAFNQFADLHWGY
jgi:hypothetical protein